ncbi:MAG: TetR/AcrR family transcriptional regulator [Thermoleophilaceae bacterium]
MPSRKAGKTHEASRVESRTKLLEAGVELILEHAQRNPFASLRVRTICERAGYSTGAFYVHWTDTDAFQLELGEHLLSDAMTQEDFQTLNRVADEGLDRPLIEALSRLAFADLDELVKNRAWDANELLNVTWGRSRLREAGVRGYREVDRATAELYGRLLEAHGREPRPPFTMLQIAVLLQGLVEGLGLRQKIDPEALEISWRERKSLYAVGVVALLSVLTRRRGTRAELDDVLGKAFEDT